jgi:hypothetical protein
MPAGYATSTQMESVFSAGFEFGAELSDLRVIEEPVGTSRPPSNIVQQGNSFDLYTDIHFVSVPGVTLPPLPNIDVYVQYFLEGFGGAAENQTDMVQVGSNWGLPPYDRALRVDVPESVYSALTPGVYKIAAAVHVTWVGDPVTQPIMSGFIEGAPLQIV